MRLQERGVRSESLPLLLSPKVPCSPMSSILLGINFYIPLHRYPPGSAGLLTCPLALLQGAAPRQLVAAQKGLPGSEGWRCAWQQLQPYCRTNYQLRIMHSENHRT